MGNRLVSFYYKLISFYYDFGEYRRVFLHEALDESTMVATILAALSAGHGKANQNEDTTHYQEPAPDRVHSAKLENVSIK